MSTTWVARYALTLRERQHGIGLPSHSPLYLPTELFHVPKPDNRPAQQGHAFWLPTCTARQGFMTLPTHLKNSESCMICLRLGCNEKERSQAGLLVYGEEIGVGPEGRGVWGTGVWVAEEVRGSRVRVSGSDYRSSQNRRLEDIYSLRPSEDVSYPPANRPHIRCRRLRAVGAIPSIGFCSFVAGQHLDRRKLVAESEQPALPTVGTNARYAREHSTQARSEVSLETGAHLGSWWQEQCGSGGCDTVCIRTLPGMGCAEVVARSLFSAMRRRRVNLQQMQAFRYGREVFRAGIERLLWHVHSVCSLLNLHDFKNATSRAASENSEAGGSARAEDSIHPHERRCDTKFGDGETTLTRKFPLVSALPPSLCNQLINKPFPRAPPLHHLPYHH